MKAILFSSSLALILMISTLNANETEPIMLKEIGQIALEVEDLDRATQFYKENLGMGFLFTVPTQFSFFNCDGIRLLLGLPESGKKRSENNIVYFRVEDIDATFRLLSDKGVVFSDSTNVVAKLENHDLWMTEFQDSGGDLLALMEERPR